jgi:hypothetical protein
MNARLARAMLPAALIASAGAAAQPALGEIEAAVLADARQRSGASEVRIVRTEPVTWPDGAIGCPEPGRMVTQALVPGWRIEVQAGSERLDYHAARGGRWLYCPPGRGTPPAAKNSGT